MEETVDNAPAVGAADTARGVGLALTSPVTDRLRALRAQGRLDEAVLTLVGAVGVVELEPLEALHRLGSDPAAPQTLDSPDTVQVLVPLGLRTVREIRANEAGDSKVIQVAPGVVLDYASSAVAYRVARLLRGRFLALVPHGKDAAPLEAPEAEVIDWLPGLRRLPLAAADEPGGATVRTLRRVDRRLALGPAAAAFADRQQRTA